MRKTNKAGVELIKKFEGLRLTAYQDSVGVWTIGYGHTRTAREGMKITEPEAEALLRDDLADAESDVSRMVSVPLNDNQFAALVSFVFNLGGNNFAFSTLRKMLNKGLYEGAGKQFARWNKAGGKVLPGLSRRRDAERELFLKGE